MANKERKSQLGFNLNEETLTPPEVLNLAPESINLVTERPIWQGRKKGIGYFIDFATKSEETFNQSNWQLIKPDSKSKITAVVINIPENPGEELASLLLSRATSKLGESGVVIGLEHKGEEVSSKDEKLETLKAAGLVKGNIVNNKSDFIIWEGRVKKKAKKTKREFDLRESKSYWVRKKVENSPELVRRMYLKYGFEIVDRSVIEYAITHSTFIPRDLGALELGFGIRVKAPCDCESEIDIRGNITRVINCGDSECIGEPPEFIQENVKKLELIRPQIKSPRQQKPWTMTKEENEKFERDWKAFIEKEN